MRDSLKQSAADSPIRGFEKYRAGSIVLCNNCSKPIFKLDRAVCLGDKAGKMASAFKPLSAADIRALADRDDIDAGISGMLRHWTPEDIQAHLDKLHEMRSGDPMLCPACDDCFVQVLSVDRHEVLDKAYTIEMLVIAPAGIESAPVRGRQIGTDKSWVHEGAKLIH
jgi:hypothetical protein